MRRCLMFLAFALAPAVVRADTPAKAQPWPFDIIRLRNGAVLRGLILDSDETRVRFQCVHRHPGRPTVSFPTVIGKGEIDQIERLPAEQRQILQAHLQDLERSTPEGEKERMEGLDLQEVPWGTQPRGGWRYSSDFFTLTSNAPEEIVRRAALRLEQIYVAYARFLPARHQGGRPTAVLLITDLKEYSRMLREQKQQFLNPAFYDPAGNRIVCASDLEGLGQKLAAVKQLHQRMRADLDRAEADYSKLYKGKERLALLQPIADKRRELNAADKRNNDQFDLATRVLFATLYHEAFHAYAASFVYPPPGELPR